MLKKSLTVPRILWFALVVASLLYVVVLFVLEASGSRRHAQAQPSGLAIPFLVVCTALAVVSFVLPASLYRKSLQDVDLAHAENGAQGLKLPGAQIRRLLALFQSPFILSMALSESVSLFGFVLRFLGYPWEQAGPLLGAGTLLLLLRFPTPKSVLGPLEELRSVRVDPSS